MVKQPSASVQSDSSKRLLMICYNYPPMNNGGVERSLKFVRYLPEFGWSPIVLTTKLHGSCEPILDESVVRTHEPRSLYHSLAESARRRKKRLTSVSEDDASKGLHRRFPRLTPNWIDRWLMIPDGCVKWCTFALWPALLTHRTQKADILYTTSPPVSSHLLGLVLKKLSRKPWVLDLRDPWTFEPLNRYLLEGGSRLSLERRLERLCLKNADVIIVNTPGAAAVYKENYQEFAGKIRTITNGYDSDEMSKALEMSDKPVPWKHMDNGVFVISHSGTFVRYESNDPTPHALLGALSNLVQSGTITKQNCRVVLAGQVHPQTYATIRQLGLDDIVDLPGLISHLDSLRLMLRSDLLLVYDPEERGETYVRGKTYEYLASGRPILGILPNGAGRALLERSGRALFARPDDADDIGRALAKAICDRGSTRSECDLDLNSFERRHLTHQLAALLDDQLT